MLALLPSPVNSESRGSGGSRGSLGSRPHTESGGKKTDALFLSTLRAMRRAGRSHRTLNQAIAFLDAITSSS